MEIFSTLYIFVVGLVFGSFYNVVGMRVPAGESIIQPRSHCPQCKKTLEVIDLIPFFSYLLWRGRCRNCSTSISIIYPIIELLTGGIFMAAWLTFGFTWETLTAMMLLSLLIIITVSDLRFMRIPDKILLFFGILFVAMRFTLAPLDPWWDAIAGAAIGFFLLLLIAVASKGGMGGGDIKLFLVLGIFFGWQLTLVAFFLSVLLGAVLGLLGMLIGKVKRGVPMPFGPYIAAGSVLTLFYGRSLLDWYSYGFF